jgi:hypothetical protein
MVTKKAHQHWSQRLRVHIMRLPDESLQSGIRKVCFTNEWIAGTTALHQYGYGQVGTGCSCSSAYGGGERGLGLRQTMARVASANVAEEWFALPYQ